MIGGPIIRGEDSEDGAAELQDAARATASGGDVNGWIGSKRGPREAAGDLHSRYATARVTTAE